MRVLLGYELVVIKHQYNLMGQLGELVYEHGKRCLDEPLSHGAHSHENIGSKVLFFWHSPAQSLYYVPPQPDRIVVLLVEGDPGEGQLGFFYLTPLGQKRRLPVAGRGAYDAYLAVQSVLRSSSNLRRTSCSGRGNGARNLGLRTILGESALGSLEAVNNGLLCSRRYLGSHTHRTADQAPLAPAPLGQGPQHILPDGN